MMISGANSLYNNKKTVDDLNVFPVPDGDTGTNMSMTVTSMAKSLKELVSPSVTKVADAMSYATLRGARGNSGVILSQFFRGIAKGLKGLDECDVKQFSNALSLGSKAAYKAVMKPTEGTILTVSREVSESALKRSQESDDFCDVISFALEKGNRILLKTPDMLPALKKAGVVDAGGQGWIYFLAGVLEYLKTGKVVEGGLNEDNSTSKQSSAQSTIDTKNIKYMYCTEFIVEKSSANVNTNSFRTSIENKGDSMLVIDDDEIVKVHIHTNNPGYVLERAVLLGNLINIKIDNMKHQHQSIISATEEKSQTVIEETPVEKKPYSFVGICVGEGLSQIFKDIGIDKVIEGGQTMNPSTDDILNAVNGLNADTIFVFPNNKNIIMAAEQAAEISDKNVVVIPTRTIPQCISAMLKFSEKKDVQKNIAAMNKATEEVKTGQITFAVRDTEIDELIIKEGDIIGMSENKISLTGKDPSGVLFELVEEIADEDSEFLTVYYGEDIDKETAQSIEEELSDKYPDLEVSVKYGGQALYYYIISVE